MKNIFLFLVIFGVISCCLLSCNDEAPIQGFNLADSKGIGKVDSTTISKISLENSFKDSVVATGASPFLLLGAFNGFETQILIKFATLPDSFEVTTAAIILRTNSIIGLKTSKSSFNANVHRITSEWDESKVTYENFQNAFDVNSIGEAKILSAELGFSGDGDSLSFETVRFDLTAQAVDLINDWNDTTSMVENYGVLIDYTNSHFIKEFFSSNTGSTAPRLEVVVRNNDSELDTLVVNSTADAFIVHSLTQPPFEPLYVDHVFNSQSLLKFDISEIPKESTVNRVTMEISIDNENSILTDDGFTLQLLRLNEPFSSPDSMNLDTDLMVVTQVTRTQSSITFPPAEFVGAFTRIIQDWVSQNVDNNGFIMRSGTPGLDVARIAFVSALKDSIEGTHVAPKLNVDFTVAPTIPHN